MGFDLGHKMPELQRFLLTCALLLLVGCSDKELLSSVDEQQSREVLIALSQSGIKADRSLIANNSIGGESRYAVVVARGDFSRALEVLQSYDLPGRANQSIEFLTAPTGIVPNAPEIAALRADFILARSVERILSDLAGVVRVRAVVRSVRPFEGSGDTTNSPRVAVVISYRTPSDKFLTSNQEVVELIAQVVPGAKGEKVTIKLINLGSSEFPTASNTVDGVVAEGSSQELIDIWPVPWLNFKIPNSQQYQARVRVGLLVGITAICSFCLGIYFTVFWANSRRRFRERNGKAVNGGVSTAVREKARNKS